MTQLDFNFCQRWRQHRSSYRPAGEPIDTRRFEVRPLSEHAAKRFICEHHYSNSYPAAVFRAGLYHHPSASCEELVGVAVFSVPVNNAAIPLYTGQEAGQGCELGRFVLLDEVPANGETFFLGKAFRLLHQAKPRLKAVVAYADPMERRDAAGNLTKPGHCGTIYRAFNGVYQGRSRPRTLFATTSGQTVNERTLSKLRQQDSGREYAARQLAELGAPAIADREDPAEYLARVEALGVLRRVRHPGNHVFSWALRERRRGGT